MSKSKATKAKIQKRRMEAFKKHKDKRTAIHIHRDTTKIIKDLEDFKIKLPKLLTELNSKLSAIPEATKISNTKYTKILAAKDRLANLDAKLTEILRNVKDNTVSSEAMLKKDSQAVQAQIALNFLEISTVMGELMETQTTIEENTRPPKLGPGVEEVMEYDDGTHVQSPTVVNIPHMRIIPEHTPDGVISTTEDTKITADSLISTAVNG